MKNALEMLLTSKARAEILRLLFSDAPANPHLSELARHTGLTVRAVRQEIQKLKKLDLLKERRDGNRLYYEANRAHPIFPEIQNLVLKLVGPVPILRGILKNSEVLIAFLFGSVARKEEKATSDIDLIVIGNLGKRKLFSLLGNAAEKLGREINPHVYTAEEFSKRIQSKDHFLTSVLATPLDFIKGNRNELERLAKERMA